MVRFVQLLMAVDGGVGGAGAGGVLATTALAAAGLDATAFRVPLVVAAVGVGALLGWRYGLVLGRGIHRHPPIPDRR